ncbi:up-regulator of cell proliferation-like [Xenopus tropicalis]|nr:up-regulator of cell proliferation-like [Xenopus tropicalis]
MALDSTARNTTINSEGGDVSWYDNPFQNLEPITQNSIHPLDVVCAVLHCSDNFLQQEIISKMSMCQFAVPLILPPSHEQDCTFLLWALRGIVKRWRPQSLTESKGFIEDNLVNIKMPTFSFVRLGDCNISKSRILNQLLCQTQSYYDIFVNRDMLCENAEKTIADGLVEMSWFFPGSVNKSELFPEPAAIINLRGDLATHWRQFNFLTHVSSAVFIFTKYFSEKEYKLFLNCKNINTDYYFVIDSSDDIETKKIFVTLKELSKVLKVHVLKSNHRNIKELIRAMQHYVAKYLAKHEAQLSLQDLADVATKFGFQVDENSTECKKAKTHADSITNEIKNVFEYKKKTMPLQGVPWKEISKIEKELCRMKHQGSTNIDIYKRKLEKKCSELHRTQYECEIPHGIRNYMNSLMTLSVVEKCYLMGWMKFYLDGITRSNLSGLQAEYKEKCNELPANPSEINKLHDNISDSSLGVDHFLREVGQFYEAECAMVKEKHIQPNEKKFYRLPGLAADLLLNGFPLELIDGDASNIPLQWVTDVLTELNKKTAGRCRMRVITVLGVQSTGKSTLLNTMFGLQFPVASGRCTRGAFMTLIKIKENLQKELGCEFIMVIDTEGLNAPELASLEDSYEHDNELATLVIGLSDITIVNIAMENTSEMKDILQIVVHAFLRMKEVGRKSNCFLVHQNVSDVSAYLNNRINRNKLLNELNDMTRVAAKMEKIDAPMQFSDIMNYDPDKHSWYIPGLWHGVPPMAPINFGYSENIFKLKKYLINFMKKSQNSGPQDIDSFTEWMNSLWKAVKYETFIFSFRNSLVAEAYEQLSMKYSELEWNFRSQVYSSLTEQENIIKNQPQSRITCVTTEILEHKMPQLLDREEAYMKEQLKLFFDSSSSRMYVAERYRADFMGYVKCLRKNMEVIISSKCWEAVKIQSGKHEIHNMQETCLRLIEEKVGIYLKTHTRNARDMSNAELRKEFDLIWDKILQELQVGRLRKRRIDNEMLEQLKREMTNRGGSVKQTLHNVLTLKYYGQNEFKMEKTYINIPFWSAKNFQEFFTNGCYNKLASAAWLLEHQCQIYVTDRINTGEDYNEIYCQELLNIINQKLNQEEVRKLHPTASFEANLKLHILGTAAPQFQKMHDDFGLKNDPRLLINRLKPQYFDIFKNKLQEKDESNARAKDFCDQCLKPAITDHIYKNLGKDITHDILKDPADVRFNSQNQFHFRILKELLEMNTFENYAEYIKNYEIYVKRWISKYIITKYKTTSGLDVLITKIISSIAEKIQSALNDKNVQRSQNVSEFCKFFRQNLVKHLVISDNAMKVIIFQNTVDIHRLSSNITFHLKKCQEEIRSEMKQLGIESILACLSLKPQDELLKKVLGCGKKCPFCNAPCETRGDDHQEHFVSAHRPKGLAQYTFAEDNNLCTASCSTDIISNGAFRNPDTEGTWHPYREYRSVYPQWIILPEINPTYSLYWKFVLTQFNYDFANLFQANPADIPEEWLKITQRQALSSLQDTYYIK